MISLQNAMLVALGFLLACLFAFVIAPAYRRRLERLASDRVRRLLPMSEAEMRADRDRVRAESAVRVFTLERQVEQARLASARQTIDSSRRDARIMEVENESRELKSALDEAQNARIVLEQTITDRLPKVEHRLAEAKKLLYQRDREIAVLTNEAGKSARALEEAFQGNVRNRAEIEKLSNLLKAQQEIARSSERAASGAGINVEIDTLRARVRDQAALIRKLQAVDGHAADTKVTYSTDDATVDALRVRISVAEQALEQAGAAHAAALAEQTALAEQQQHALSTKLQEQATAMARLQATLAVLQEAQAAPEASQAPPVTLAPELAVSPVVGQPSVSDGLRTVEPAPPVAAARDRRPLAERLVGLTAHSGNGEVPAGQQAATSIASNVAALAAASQSGGRGLAARDRNPQAEDADPSPRLAERLSGIAKA